MTTKELKKLHNQYYTEQASAEWVLDKLVNNGYCPALVFDDDGRWALSFDGAMPMVMGDEAIEMTLSTWVPKKLWQSTISGAILTGIEHLILEKIGDGDGQI